MVICRIMGWDYAQYQAAPYWFIELVQPTIDIEQKVEAIKSKNEAARQQRG